MARRQFNVQRQLGLLGAAIIVLSLTMPTWAGKPNPKPPNIWLDIWQRIIRSRDREKPRTSRGLICPVMPQFIERRSLWHDRPTFIWQGRVDSIAVYAFSDPSTPVWTVSTVGSANVIYSKKALQPGKRYIWNATSAGEQTKVIFEILNQPTRDRITAQLTQLEAQLKQSNALPEEQIRQRVSFFLDRDLFLDAVQELYSVQQPSQNILALRHKLIEEVCSNQTK